MAVFDATTIDAAIQVKVDALTTGSSLDEILQCAIAAGAAENRSNVVADVASLPTDLVTNGTVVYVDSIGIPVIFANSGWYGLDGIFFKGVRQEGWAWGYNSIGRIGDNTTVNKSSPVSVVGGFTWKQISAGPTFSMTVTPNDTIWAWGGNNVGQLGERTTQYQSNQMVHYGLGDII
jgi:hypothetical protein